MPDTRRAEPEVPGSALRVAPTARPDQTTGTGQPRFVAPVPTAVQLLVWVNVGQPEPGSVAWDEFCSLFDGGDRHRAEQVSFAADAA